MASRKTMLPTAPRMPVTTASVTGQARSVSRRRTSRNRSGCAAHGPRAVVAAADRTAADRALDAGRRPEALLRFIDVRRGMHVAELGAGGGYTTELLARSVGENGVVYAQNSQFILDRFAAK